MLHSKIKSLRIQKGLHQADMAEQLNISVNTYGKIENGSTKLVDFDRLQTIATALNTSAAELLGITEVQQVFNEKVEHGYIKTIHTLNTDNKEMMISLLKEMDFLRKEIERLSNQNNVLLDKLFNKK